MAAHLTAITSPVYIPQVSAFIDTARVRHPHIQITQTHCDGAVCSIERTRYTSSRELRNSESCRLSIAVDTLSQMGVGILNPVLSGPSKLRGRLQK